MIVMKAAREHRRWRRASPSAEGNKIRRLVTNKKGEGVMIAPRMAAAGGGCLWQGLFTEGEMLVKGREDAHGRTVKRLDRAMLNGLSVAIWLHLACATTLWSARELRVTDRSPPIDNGNDLYPTHVGA